MTTQKKIAVVGAGTAGLSAAIALRAKGFSPILFEKHALPSSRGAGLLVQPAGIEAFGKLGVGKDFHAASTPISWLLGESHTGRKVVDVRYGAEPARAITRRALAQLLTDEAHRLGVDLRFNTGVVDVNVSQDGVNVQFAEHTESYDALVIADGADSTLRVKAGLGITSTAYPWGALWGLFDVQGWAHSDALVQRYRGTKQMFGLMPTAVRGESTTLSLFWSLKLSEAQLWRNGALETFKEELVKLWPESASVVGQIHSHSQLTLARYQHAWPRRLGVPRVYVAGDCAHSMSPSLGLGSTLAAQDALALADCHASHGALRGPNLYSRARLRQIQWYQGLSRVLTPCFQGDRGGFARDSLFGLAASLPPTRWLMRRSLVT